MLVARACLKVARLQRPFAALAAVLFAAHPVHTEAVSGVVGRADVLACIFFLSSLLVYHGASSGKHYVWLSVVLGGLSMLAKETGVTVLVLNLAFDLYRCWPSVKKTLVGVKWTKKNTRIVGRASKVLISLLLLITARLALLQGSLPTFSQQDNPTAFHPSIYVRFLTFCYLAAFNWWLLICPWTLSHDWQMGSVPLVTSLADSRNLLTCAALAVILLLSYRCFSDLQLQRHTPAVLGLLLLVLPYVPASNIFVTVGFVVAERVLYIPSVGSVMITVYGMQLMWRSMRGSRRLLALSAGVLVVSGVARTQLRNRDWRSRESLLRADLATLPLNAKLHYNYANFLRDGENPEHAINHYREALRLWPSYASAHNNLGTLLVASGKAEYHFMQAIKYSRDHVNAHYNLGKLFRKNNKSMEALRMLERCVTLQPSFAMAYLELLIMKPQRDKGPLLRHLIMLQPENWEHHVMYARWLRSYGLSSLAMKYYFKAMKLTFKKEDLNKLTRPDLASLREAALELRHRGQQSRILQLLTRWHTFRRGWRSEVASNVYLREWRLRMELSSRAKAYSEMEPATHKTKTCLDHTQLDGQHGYEVNKLSRNHSKANKDFSLPADAEIYNRNTNSADNHTIVVASTKTVSRGSPRSVKDSREDEEDRGREPQFGTKKRALSLAAPYKPIHNKSETGHKQKSCSIHKKDRGKIRKPKATISPFITDHLIHTF